VDVVCLVLLVLAAVIAMSGGFRVRFWGMRLALTSPYRVVIAAVALAVLRHWFAPSRPVYQDLPARIRSGWRTPAARAAWSAFIGTRFAVLLVGYLAVVMFGYNNGRPPLRVSENEIANLQMRWDSAWYFGIATEGYRMVSQNPRQQENVVFFPAFPMLMRMGGRLLGGTSLAYVAAGSLVAFGAFFSGLLYLFRLARDLLDSDDAARYAVWLLAAYPFAWFFSAMYTESLFLLGAAGAFYHFRRRDWLKAGAWGLLVGLTRPNGCFLSIPLAIVAIAPWLPSWIVARNYRAPSDGRDLRQLVPALASAAMPGIGVLLYSAFIWNLTGHPLTWASGHAAWGREYTGLATVVIDRYTWLSESGLYAYTSRIPADMLNLCGALFVIAAAWPVARRLELAFAIFILINILPPLAAGGTLSAGRFSSVLFPAFIWLATVVPDRHRPAWLASFMAVQAFGAALFYTWHELF
jgi:hypothetical protein